MKLLPRASLFLLLAAPLVFAQQVMTTSEMDQKAYAVGQKLKCQCGCSYTVASCNMLECHYREKIKPVIREHLEAGLSVPVVVERIVQQFGSELRTAPRTEGFGMFGWAMPFVALLVGLIVAPIVVVRWHRRQAAAARVKQADESTLSRYQDQIEKEVAQLE